jgi:hypothetical protein
VGQPVVNGELAQWNVAALSREGPHVLRVVAVDRQGMRFESAPVRVMALHDATPTPTEPPTETPTPLSSPSPTATAGATPTATALALPSPSPTATASATPTATALALPSPSPTATETPVPLPSPTLPVLPLILAEIEEPSDGDILAGATPIIGVAGGPAFASYALEVLLGAVWTPVIPDAPLVFTPATGTLGVWNTTTAPNGAYTLRLVVNGMGGEVSVATVSVLIAN